MRLVVEEKIIKEKTRLDFEPRLSKWLIEQGFERELHLYSLPARYAYKHKELPIRIEPRQNNDIWFGNYEIAFCEIVYLEEKGCAQLSSVKSYSGTQLNTLDLLEDVQNKMQKAFELAKKIVKKFSEGE